MNSSTAPGWFDSLSLALTLLGFLVAYIQLKRTRASADAATLALKKAEQRLGSDQAIALPGLFADVGNELLYVEEGGAPEVARFALLRLHSLSNESSTVILGIGGKHEKLARRVERLGRRALAAKGELGGETSAADVVRPINILLSEARGELTKLAAEIKNRVSANAADE